MPPKRAGEPKEVPECILKIGKYNNVVAWSLEILPHHEVDQERVD